MREPIFFGMSVLGSLSPYYNFFIISAGSSPSYGTFLEKISQRMVPNANTSILSVSYLWLYISGAI